ncbi:RICIN domain-containing protein [Actinoplanes sp. GCM10030250]|uniref:RICIN domain-containing protein n=1 Tax=Actinoplanes sp. GCM10030250 TaxID=3273376 RepID=UPI00361FFEF0
MRRLFSWLAMVTLVVAGLLMPTGSPAIAMPSSGVFEIKNVKSGQCLDQSYSGGVERSQVYVLPCNDRDNQLWVIYTSDSASPYHEISNFRSKKCLNQSYANGTETSNVIAFPCNGSTNGLNMRWGNYWNGKYGDAIANHASGKCLDQDWTGNKPNPGLLAYPCKSFPVLTDLLTNQHWVFVKPS